MADIYNEELLDPKIVESYNALDSANDALDDAETKFNGISINIDEDICTTMEKVKELNDIITQIKNIFSEGNLDLTLPPGFENSVYAQIILKYLEALLLKGKRLILKIQLKAETFSKEMVIGMVSGKGSSVPDPITIAIGAIFTALGLAINAVIIIIDTLMNLISVGPLGVDAQGMCFFLTPKSFKTTKINIFNLNQMHSTRLPEPVQRSIFEILKSVEKINNAIKITAIAAAAVKGATEIMKDNPNFEECPVMERVKPGKIIKKLEILLDLLPLPMGLPSYEKLKFTNLGFVVFLITGFELAAHQSFGIPGQY